MELNIPVMVSKVYTKLNQYAKEKEIIDIIGCLEVYNYLNEKHKSITTMMPLENHQYFDIWENP